MNRFWIFSLSLFVTLLLISTTILLVISKGDMVYWINGLNSPLLNFFFKATSSIGNGLIFVYITLGLLLLRFKYALVSLLVGLFNLVFVAIFKRQIFSEALRPSRLLDHDLLYFVPGVDVHGQMSFPSGHTTTAFAVALLIILIFQSKRITILMAFYAIAVACSRMYLVQHFYVDTYFGMFLGLFSTFLAWFTINKIKEYKWMNYRIKVNLGQKSERIVSVTSI